MTALNPNHLVTRSLEGQWHKVLALVLQKYADVLPADVVLTYADIDAHLRLADGLAVVAHEKADGLHLRIVTMEEARRLARLEGGLAS